MKGQIEQLQDDLKQARERAASLERVLSNLFGEGWESLTEEGALLCRVILPGEELDDPSQGAPPKKKGGK